MCNNGTYTACTDNQYFTHLLLLIGCLSSAVKQCSDTRFEYKNNIAALNDTIRYYQDKNGNLVATKLAFESDINTLKLLNKDLYNQIKDLKAKGNVTEGTYFAGVIENPKQDTAYIVTHDTISRGFIKDFAFNNEYRTLEGNVSYNNDTVGVNIEKDQVAFDYIVALDDKNNIMQVKLDKILDELYLGKKKDQIFYGIMAKKANEKFNEFYGGKKC